MESLCQRSLCGRAAVYVAELRFMSASGRFMRRSRGYQPTPTLFYDRPLDAQSSFALHP